MNALLPTDLLRLQDDVRGALERGAPVVALESTIIAHGMPFPQNLETARAVEAVVREHGAVPATVAVMDGFVRVGLDEGQLERLAAGEGVLKLSRRDLPYALARGLTGATTVAATMICADLAGVRVFATGGIGGVHRGAGASFDVSADLQELARTPVAVVCAGAKSILDLPATLEVLETLGVPVIGYRTDEFPAFYSRGSGLEVPFRLDAPEEVARFLRTQWRLGLGGGAVIANPAPEADALPADAIEAAIGRALAEAEAEDVHGRDVTPFLLEKIQQLTGGASLKANIALVKHNAQVAARIAAALAALAEDA